MLRYARFVFFTLILGSTSAAAQIPHIYGTWKLNTAVSTYPGPMPQIQVRTYRPIDDDSMVGLAVTIDAEGNPSFLQYAGKIDASEYSEYELNSLAQFQISGESTPLSYSEVRLDDYAVAWTDQFNGEACLSGTKRVSEDGQTLTIEFDAPGSDGENQHYSIVFDKQ